MTRFKSWEEKCERCGRCCYEKIEFEGKVYYSDVPCEKLDTETKLCTVYENRQEARPGCTHLSPRILGLGILPADCPYVLEVEDYPAPVLDQAEKANEFCR